MHRNLKMFQQLVHSVTAMHTASLHSYCTIYLYFFFYFHFFMEHYYNNHYGRKKSMKVLPSHYKNWVLSLVVIIVEYFLAIAFVNYWQHTVNLFTQCRSEKKNDLTANLQKHKENERDRDKKKTNISNSLSHTMNVLSLVDTIENYGN